jgi:hypothetical protein
MDDHVRIRFLVSRLFGSWLETGLSVIAPALSRRRESSVLGIDPGRITVKPEIDRR